MDGCRRDDCVLRGFVGWFFCGGLVCGWCLLFFAVYLWVCLLCGFVAAVFHVEQNKVGFWIGEGFVCGFCG